MAILLSGRGRRARQQLDLTRDTWREQVHLAVGAEAGETGVRESRLAPRRRLRQRAGCRGTPHDPVAEVVDRHSARPGGDHREAALDHVNRQVDAVDEPAADVTRDGADTHPREGLAQASGERVEEVLDRVGGRQLLRTARPGELGRELHGETRMDDRRPDSECHRHRVDVEHVSGVGQDVGPAAQTGSREGRVDGADRQDGRDRQPLVRDRAIADEQDLDARLARRDRLPPERLEAAGETGATLGERPGRVQHPHTATARQHDLEQAVEVRDDRALEPQRPRSSWRATQQRRSATELHPQVHDHALPLRVDGGVGDLGEGLAEVVDRRAIETGTSRGRGVVAHAPQRLVHLDGHRLDIETGLLGLETGDIAQPMVERASALHDRGRRFGAVLVQRPRGVVDRQMAQDVHLGVGILEDRPATRLDEQHLARPEPPSPDRVGRFERHGARFGRDRDEAVGRDGESSRPQPVAVDERADPSTICEHDRGRAIPGRQHPGRPAPERGDVRMRSSPQSDRLGDGREQRRSEIPAGRREQLQALVERQRIRAIGREQRAGVEQVGSDPPGAAVPRPAPDLLPVAADRVDLAVVRDRAERLGETPHGRRVRGVPLVEHGIRQIDVCAEIRVQVGEARPGDEAFVDDGQRGH